MSIITSVYDHREFAVNPYQTGSNRAMSRQVTPPTVAAADEEIVRLLYVGWVKNLTIHVVSGSITHYFSISDDLDWQAAGFWVRSSSAMGSQNKFDNLVGPNTVFFLSDTRTPVYPHHRFVDTQVGGGSVITINMLG